MEEGRTTAALRRPRPIWIEERVFDNYGPLLGAHGLAVYLGFCRYAEEDISPSELFRKICKRTSIPLWSIQAAVDTIVRMGLIHTRRNSRGELVYTLVDAPGDPPEWVTEFNRLRGSDE